MRVELSGTRNGQPWPKRGEAIDLPDDEATHYCTVGLAEPVTEPEVETAVAPEAEVSAPTQPEKPAPAAAEKRGPRKPGKQQ